VHKETKMYSYKATLVEVGYDDSCDCTEAFNILDEDDDIIATVFSEGEALALESHLNRKE
jgi:hypothetical protein